MRRRWEVSLKAMTLLSPVMWRKPKLLSLERLTALVIGQGSAQQMPLSCHKLRSPRPLWLAHSSNLLAQHTPLQTGLTRVQALLSSLLIPEKLLDCWKCAAPTYKQTG